MSYLLIDEIETRMKCTLNKDQMNELHNALVQCVTGSVLDTSRNLPEDQLIQTYLAAKKIEGCSPKTLHYYEYTLNRVLHNIGKSIRSITTADIRNYLSDYQSNSSVSKTTLDNVRRILSSFFSWLEDEDLIFKSPVRRIHKVKTSKLVKETYSDEELEILRDGCNEIRDLAMLDLLISTGMRVGELVNLDINDVDLLNRECVVLGKGDKQRLVYFDARTKVHLSKYLQSRNDSNPALFVSLLSPYERIKISGVEIRLKNIGRQLQIDKVHPHRFRRTLATNAIDKGMPIEQVQQLLGHSKIDTTLLYAQVNQNNVKESHRKYIC